jgi:type 1 glutamine amidotransferase
MTLPTLPLSPSKSSASRRALLRVAAAGALGAAASPLWSLAAEAPKGKGQKILCFTRSQGFAHPAVTRRGTELAFGEKFVQEVGTRVGYDITVSKDGTLFNPDKIGQWDGFIFCTTGNLTGASSPDNTPPLTAEGLQAFYKAVEAGKGFMGIHNATDTNHSRSRSRYIRPEKVTDNSVDPFIIMIGGEFSSHGSQQKATIRRAPGCNFPGLEEVKDFEMTEEWFAQINLAPDLHVLLIQDTTTMVMANGQREQQYRRDPYPQTWARMHGKGRVFYESMGHREDVWKNPIFEKVFLAGLHWMAGTVDAEIPPNLEKACPELWAAHKPQ